MNELALSCGILSKSDLAYRNRILIIYSQNTLKPKPVSFKDVESIPHSNLINNGFIKYVPHFY